MQQKQSLLRSLPAVDLLLQKSVFAQQPRAAVLRAIRAELDALRASILCGEIRTVPPQDLLCAAILDRLHKAALAPCPVINATGVVLHTNLGRAPLASEAIEAVCQTAKGYTNLEYEVKTGTRGSRNVPVESLLCALTGCEAALVVNNNAAALLLALTALSYGKQAIVSRGELVEIGDSFRIPEIMLRSGAQLLEVGTTNKTHLRDYEQAINEKTGVLLKVHTSNFKVIGFTESVSMQQLAKLGRVQQIPTLYDLGSGAFLQETAFAGEPTVQDALKQGADIVCFSGDKLLGGPQAGILLGRADLIAQMKRDPLARALRMDKLSLAALYATLKLYESPETVRERVPVLQMLCAQPEILKAKAQQLYSLLVDADCEIEVIAVTRPAGGGSMPGRMFSGYAVAVVPRFISVEDLEGHLRAHQPPVIARIHDGKLLLDPSAIPEELFSTTAKAVREGCHPCSI